MSAEHSSLPAPAASPHAESSSADTLLAIQNALKLGGSLLVTWGIALGMRLFLPRYLGPDLLGTLSFADAFAATFFVALSLGADVYVRKEISVRPEHASDFFGGTLALRVVMSLAIFAVMGVVMHAGNRPPAVQLVVYVFAAAQFFVNANATLSALLHAKGRVGGVSALAVATKVVWAAGVLAAMLLHVGLWGFAAAFLLSEAIETFVLYALAKRHLGLEMRFDVPATKAMIISSLPYYLNTFATTAYGKLDVSWLAFVASSTEVGWYAASSAIAGLTLLVTPLIGWVLIPTFARAAARSQEDLFARIRSSTELILAVAIPVSLFISLSADLVVKTLFGEAYMPAVLALRILAGTFVITYVAIVYAVTLLMLERAWTLTIISIAGLVVNVLLNILLVRPSLGWFGEGGGGVGCALAMLGTEIFVTTAMVSIVGRRAFDRRTVSMVLKSAAACALVVVVDRYAVPLGWFRLAVDAAVYLVVVVSTGALRIREIVELVMTAVRAKTANLSAAATATRTEG